VHLFGLMTHQSFVIPPTPLSVDLITRGTISFTIRFDLVPRLLLVPIMTRSHLDSCYGNFIDDTCTILPAT
jgi:hypothetical protein